MISDLCIDGAWRSQICSMRPGSKLNPSWLGCTFRRRERPVFTRFAAQALTDERLLSAERQPTLMQARRYSWRRCLALLQTPWRFLRAHLAGRGGSRSRF